MRRGAFDYLPKPFTPAQVRAVLERVARVRGLRDRVADLEERVRAEVPEADLGAATRMSAGARPGPAGRRRPTRRPAPGRERDRQGGPRPRRPRLEPARRRAVRHRPLPQPVAELLESDLFGHVRGAFTGAVRDTAGKVAAADGGTLFLDEVGDLPAALQPKLLRFLQERRYERVGEAKTRTADVRIVAATNRDLEADVAAGAFREDLLYRLNVDRGDPAPAAPPRRTVLDLADHLLAFFARQTGRRLTGFTAEARAAIARHAWPGNLRELRNAVERAAILAAGPEVGLADLPERVAGAAGGRGEARSRSAARSRLERLEAEHIRRVVAASPSLDEAAGRSGSTRAPSTASGSGPSL